jgi:hypothetical protein
VPLSRHDIEELLSGLSKKDTPVIVDGVRVYGDLRMNSVLARMIDRITGFASKYGFSDIVVEPRVSSIDEYRSHRGHILVNPVFDFRGSIVDPDDIVEYKVVFSYMLPYGRMLIDLYKSRVPKTRFLTHNIVVQGYLMIGFDSRLGILVLPRVFSSVYKPSYLLIANTVLAYADLLLSSARSGKPFPFSVSTIHPFIRDSVLLLGLRPTRVDIVVESARLFDSIRTRVNDLDVIVYNRDKHYVFVGDVDAPIEFVRYHGVLYRVSERARMIGKIAVSVSKTPGSYRVERVDGGSVRIVIGGGDIVWHPNIDPRDGHVCTGSYSPDSDFASLIRRGKSLFDSALVVLYKVYRILLVPNLDSAYTRDLLNHVHLVEPRRDRSLSSRRSS